MKMQIFQIEGFYIKFVAAHETYCMLFHINTGTIFFINLDFIFVVIGEKQQIMIYMGDL